MIDLSNYSCDKCARKFSRHCKHCYHTANKAPTRFKKKKKTGCETPEFRKTTPTSPPNCGSSVVKPNQNYVPPTSVKKSKKNVCCMKLEDLGNWVKTRARIGDMAYHHDPKTNNQYIYYYHKPDDNPTWMMIHPETLEKYFKKENEGENKTMYGLNLYIPFEDINTYIQECIDEKYKDQTFVPIKVEINEVDLSINIKLLSASSVEIDGCRYKLDLNVLPQEDTKNGD